MNHADLTQFPFHEQLTYDELLLVEGFLRDGFPRSVVYFWYNVTHNMYSLLNPDQIEKDRVRLKSIHPEFTQQIDAWQPNSQKQ
jgi:hypothetical protein